MTFQVQRSVSEKLTIKLIHLSILWGGEITTDPIQNVWHDPISVSLSSSQWKSLGVQQQNSETTVFLFSYPQGLNWMHAIMTFLSFVPIYPKPTYKLQYLDISRTPRARAGHSFIPSHISILATYHSPLARRPFQKLPYTLYSLPHTHMFLC